MAGMDTGGHFTTPAPVVNASEYDLLIQYGDPRSASTFHFMLVCLLTHLTYGLGSPGGYRKKVTCRFEAEAISAPRLVALMDTHPDTVVVAKAHFAFDKGPAPDGRSVPRSLWFVSSREENVTAQFEGVAVPPGSTLAAVQKYAEFVDLGLATIRHLRHVFSDVTHDQFLMVREYLSYWDIIRQCCGEQASRGQVKRLHGIKTNQHSFALDRPHCEIYDLDATEEALFNTTLWRWRFASFGKDFWDDRNAMMRRGMCCHGNAALHNGAYFKPRSNSDVAKSLAAASPREATFEANAVLVGTSKSTAILATIKST